MKSRREIAYVIVLILCLYFMENVWFLFTILVRFKWMASERKKKCNPETSVGKNEEIKRVRVGGKKSKREKNVHLKYGMASLHDVLLLEVCAIFACVRSSSPIMDYYFSFRNHKKYFIYEIMISHINGIVAALENNSSSSSREKQRT